MTRDVCERSRPHRARQGSQTLVGAVVLAVLLLVGQVPAATQEPATSTTGVPAPNIVPQPDSGAEPTEAGDRGGALQLLILGLVVLAVAAAVTHLVRQSRRSRHAPPSTPRS